MADTKNNQAGERTQPCKLNTSRIPSRLIEAQKLLIKASAILGALEDDIQYATDDLELRRDVQSLSAMSEALLTDTSRTLGRVEVIALWSKVTASFAPLRL